METSTWSIVLSPSTAEWRLRQLQREMMARAAGEVSPIHPVLTLAGPFHSGPDAAFTTLRKILTDVGAGGPAGYLLDSVGWRRGSEGWILGCRVVPSAALVARVDLLHRRLQPLVGDGGLAPPCWEVPLLRAAGRRPPAPLVSLPSPERCGLLSRLLTGLGVKNRLSEPVSCEVCPGMDPLRLPQDGLRLTILDGEESAGGFDLVTQTWLNRYRSQSREAWSATLSGYRAGAVLPLSPSWGPPYLIGDLHLGHADIIHYCSRPFPDLQTMDRTLIDGWNRVVSSGDRVYFLGDLCGSPDRVPRYRSALSGAITWVRGNHDPVSRGMTDSLHLTIDGIDLLLVHDPADAPPGFSGWIIHGHTHNRQLHRYPFLSVRQRTINVSAEVIGYRPVSLTLLVELIRTADRDLLVLSASMADGRCHPEPLSDRT